MRDQVPNNSIDRARVVGHGVTDILAPVVVHQELWNIVSIAVLSDRAGQASAAALYPHDGPQRCTDQKEGKRGRHRPDGEKHRRR
jgi:hypothetical protein